MRRFFCKLFGGELFCLGREHKDIAVQRAQNSVRLLFERAFFGKLDDFKPAKTRKAFGILGNGVAPIAFLEFSHADKIDFNH